jgi:hypothetical protein
MQNWFFSIALITSLSLLKTGFSQTNTPLFKSLSPAETNITFINNVIKRPGINILSYLYYYNGGGVAVGDINNDGLADIYFTGNNTGANKLYLNKGNFKFEDITLKSGVAGNIDWSSGVTMADVNSDGYLDIYVSAVTTIFDFKGSNLLYINNGNNTFTEKSAEYGLNIKGIITQSAFFDYDKDGDLDCFILSHTTLSNRVIMDSKERNIRHSFFKSRLLRNEKDKGINKFTDVSIESGIYQSILGYGLGLAIADLNNDGWEDIYVGNDFYETDYYYQNNGNGTFTEKGSSCFDYYSMFSMGNDIADYNNDGQLDLVTVDMLADDEEQLKRYIIEDDLPLYKQKYIYNGYHYQFSNNCLHTNNGNATSFTETSFLSGVSSTGWSWAPLFADFDNDGNKDLFITSGIPKNAVDADYVKYISSMPSQQRQSLSIDAQSEIIKKIPEGFSHPYIFKGDGNVLFKNVSSSWGFENIKGAFNGAVYSDLNNDGNLDLIINAFDSVALILKNTSPAKSYISLTFKAKGHNTFGLGTKAYVYQQGTFQYQQLMLTRGFQSSVEPRLHFGLGNNDKVDSIVIVWPNQQVQTIKNIKANQHLNIAQASGLRLFNYNIYFPEKDIAFKNITDSISIKYKHHENDFLDYYAQPLIPHVISKKGPKIAVGDVNKDGLDDFYICGAASQQGTLMIQNTQGEFKSYNDNLFKIDSAYEDVDALFFDADKDGNIDLYVVSGGNQFAANSELLLDRLYINDGVGNFKKSNNALPPINKEKSCVRASDIDNDGDIDLFIGGLVQTKKYGIPQNSYLLLNDGKGIFTSKQSVFDSLGMVTDAAFSDINNDGYSDLIVAGEWMAITVFINTKGVFQKTLIPHSEGLWQSVFITDLNNDGNADILAGNWGHNNKYWTGKTPPLRLYAGDFDNSGNQTQLITYMRDGVEYSFYGKEQIEKKLPGIKKQYLYSKDFAGVSFHKALGNFVKNTVPLQVELLGSSVAYGDGKGNFNLQELPEQLQLAPICIFQKGSNNNIFLAGGNYHDLSPYEGLYDGQPLALFKSSETKLNRLAQPNLDAIHGEVKDLKWINSIKYGKILIIARNNEQLLFYKPSK